MCLQHQSSSSSLFCTLITHRKGFVASEIHCPCITSHQVQHLEALKKSSLKAALVFLETLTNKGASQRLLGRGICRGLGLSQFQLLKSELLPRELGLGQLIIWLSFACIFQYQTLERARETKKGSQTFCSQQGHTLPE